MIHFETYKQAIAKEYASGIAKEHAYRSALKIFIESFAEGLLAVNDPQRQVAGAPDFVVLSGKEHIPIGYIETKDLTKSIDKLETNEQIARYIDAFDNFVLTNYLQFTFYHNKEKLISIEIGRIENKQLVWLPDNVAQLCEYLRDFAYFQGKPIKNANDLAFRMANKARLMKEVFHRILLAEPNPDTNELYAQYQAFQQQLIHDISLETFADMYAQTLTYGLFTARLYDTTQQDFSRKEALFLIPKNNPFFFNLFTYLAGPNLDTKMEWIVDELCEVYRLTDVVSILQHFSFADNATENAILHFYETFLTAYHPQSRKARGIFYTPKPIVNFIAQAAHDCLIKYFSLPQGLADTSKVDILLRDKDGKATIKDRVHRVQVLDPSTGTGAFLAGIIQLIHKEGFQGQESFFTNYAVNDLLPRLHGFEILMASYAICHLQLHLLLKSLGYEGQKNIKQNRISVYLTNALEEKAKYTGAAFQIWLAEEAKAANRIKMDLPIMVVVGNPPYNVSSQNKNKWIDNLVNTYKEKLVEKSFNSLSDDYVKFMRMASHYVERNKQGIVAMIVNNSFVDGNVFRRMREHLLETFDIIYIYDLHGNAKKKELDTEGNPDKNVFDIMQGVCIFIGVKYKKPLKNKSTTPAHAIVYHYDSYGKRKDKFEHLKQNDIHTVAWRKFVPVAPAYFFVPFDDKGNLQYQQETISLAELFINYNNGIKTERDSVCIHFSEDNVIQMTKDIKHLSEDDFREKYEVGNDGRDWRYEEAKKDIENNIFVVHKVLYRHFDIRYTAYTGKTKGIMSYPRYSIMKNMLHENVALLTVKRQTSFDFQHIFVTNLISESCSVSLQTGETGYHFPLYLYDDTEKNNEDDEQIKVPRRANLDKTLAILLAKSVNKQYVCEDTDKYEDSIPTLLSSLINESVTNYLTPCDILDYIYAVLHTPNYREKYKVFLKIDFPRIPYPKNVESLDQQIKLGRELRAWHTFTHPHSYKLTTISGGKGDNIINKPFYKEGKIYFNETQYIEPVSQEVWEYYVGGYQPAQKWLKDRNQLALDYTSARQYQAMLTAIHHTLRITQLLKSYF